MKKTLLGRSRSHRTKRLRVLLVEDTAERVAYFRERLGAASLSLARDFRSAARALRRGRYDVIWLDHDLDDARHNGQDVAALIAGLPKERRPGEWSSTR